MAKGKSILSAQNHASAIRKILIADDSNTERLNLSRILQAAGYQVIAAHSGNEAKALAESQRPDLIMLDIIMDDGDGYQACRTLKRNPLTQAIPIIMISSKSNAVDQQWAEKLGANAYIIKPYKDEDILQRIAALQTFDPIYPRTIKTNPSGRGGQYGNPKKCEK